MNLLKESLKKRMLKILLPCFAFVSVAFGVSMHSTFASPVIINWTEQAQPNDTIGLQGSGFGPHPEVWFARVRGNERLLVPITRLKLLTESDLFVAAQIPAGTGSGVYAVWLRSADRQIGPVWINRVRQTGYEFPEVTSGERFRIWGRNLALSGALSHVGFIDPRSGTLLPATVVRADRYVLSVIAPSNLTAGVEYAIAISNGYGGKWGAATASVRLRARRSGPDHWHLEVPWAGDFDYFQNVFNVKTDPRLAKHATGDGTTNDRSSIQAAIDKAGLSGGGVVYLPPGIYLLKFSAGPNPVRYASQQGLLLRSRVVLQGAGKSRTILSYGDGQSPNGACAVAWAPDTSVSGINGVTFRNTNNGGHWLCNIRNLGKGSELFVHDVETRLNTEGSALMWKLVSKVLLADSNFNLGGASFAPYYLESVSWFIVRNNTFHYIRKRMAITSSAHGLVEGNHSTRDAALKDIKPGDSGGLNIDFVSDLVILGNTFDTVGTVTSFNDGETINSQGCNRPYQDLGSVTGSSSMMMRDNTKHWTSFDGYQVAIVTGTGAGQWRNVIRNTPTELIVDAPWQLNPPPGSRYVLMQWSINNSIIKDNLLKDNPKGIWMYCGGADIALADNKLLDSSGILLRADQRLATNHYNLVIGATVDNNEIINQKGKTPSFIAAELCIERESIFGTGIFDVEVTRNTVRGSLSEPRDGLLANGMWSWVRVQRGSATTLLSDTSVPGILGPIFDKNKLLGCANPYNLSTGDFGSVVIDGTDTPQRLRDLLGISAPHQGSIKSFLWHVKRSPIPNLNESAQ